MLLSHGFTSRLANESEPVPLKDDEHGRYHLMYLDGFVIQEEARLGGTAEKFSTISPTYAS